MPAAGERALRLRPRAAALWLLAGGLAWGWAPRLFAGAPAGELRADAGGWRATGRGSPAARRALGTVLRRDPQMNAQMQKWISQQTRVFRREAGMREKETQDQMAARKAAYLAKLGLANKAKAVVSAERRPWHLDHLVEGDILTGSFEHPDVSRGDKVDITLTVESATGGTWKSVKGEFENEVEINSDFAIPFEKGEAKDEAMAAYIFNKFNIQWRSFDQPMPSAEDLEYISLQGLRIFFKQVADVDGFPSESEFAEAAADPQKGMTKAEFLKYMKDDDDPNYLDGAFPNIYTGRRVRFGDEDLMLDGDFQKETDGVIFGYTFVNGKGGGVFTLQLAKNVS